MGPDAGRKNDLARKQGPLVRTDGSGRQQQEGGGRCLQAILLRSSNAEETRNVSCLLYRDLVFMFSLVFCKLGSLEQS